MSDKSCPFPVPKDLEDMPLLDNLCEYCRCHPKYCGTTRSECEFLLENGGYSEAKFQPRGMWE